MKRTHLLAASALAFVAGTASANEFYTYPSGSKLTAVASGFAPTSVHNGAAPVAVQNYHGSAGQFTGNYYSEASAPANSLLKFFCVEFEFSQVGPLLYGMTTSNLVWGSTTAASQAVYNNLRKLYDLYYPNKTAGDYWNGAPTNFGAFGTSTLAAAFQLAVWEIVFDNTNLNLTDTASTFYATNGSVVGLTEAQGYLAAVNGYVGNGYQNWTLYKFSNPVVPGTAGAQDYVTATYRVPEPNALALASLALAGLGFVSRRRS